MRVGVQKILSPKLLNSQYPVLQWDTARLVFSLKCILYFCSKIIDFTNAFAQADIPIGEPLIVELPSYFMSDGYQHDFVIILNKILYGQAKSAKLWYLKF